MGHIVSLIIISIVAAISAGILADRKGRNIAGWAIVCALFPICILLLACLGSLKNEPPEAADETTCPFCAETIKKAAKVCKHCGRDLPEPETEPAQSTHEVCHPTVTLPDEPEPSPPAVPASPQENVAEKTTSQMRTFGVCLLVIALVIGGCVYLHFKKQRDKADYAVRLLDSVILSLMDHPYTYKRSGYEITETPGIRQVAVSVDFSARNTRGEQQEFTAAMTLVPEHIYAEALLKSPYADSNDSTSYVAIMTREHEKSKYESGWYKKPDDFYRRCYIGNVSIGRTSLSWDKLIKLNERLVTLRLNKEKGYPHHVPKF